MIRATHQSVKIRSVYRTLAPYETPYHWWEAGPLDRPTLVLLHGYMAHAMAFRRVVDALAQHYRLIIPDLPAHGRDQTFHDPQLVPTVNSLAVWLHHLVEAFEPPVHIVGHSLGATAAFVVGRDRQFDHVASLTLVSPGFRVPPSELGRRLLPRIPAPIARLASTRAALKVYEPMQWRGEPMGQGEVQSYLNPMKDVDRIRFLLKLGADLLEAPDRTDILKRVDAPTLVVWGAHDRLLGIENSLVIRDRLPGAQLVTLEEAGHSPMEDTPEQFVETLRDFLAEVH